MVTVRLTGLAEWTVLAVTRRRLRAAATPERGPEKGRRLQHALRARPVNEFGAILRAELAHGDPQMVLDSALAHIQPARHLRVRSPLGDQPHHFQLAAIEPVGWAVPTRLAGQGADHQPGAAAVEAGFPTVHGADDPGQLHRI